AWAGQVEDATESGVVVLGAADERQGLGAAVREAVPELPLFFEPTVLRNLTDRAPVATPVALSGSVYAPHIYTGVFQGNWRLGDRERIAASVRAASDEATANSAALLIGEFGNDPNTEIGRAWIDTALQVFDELRVGWVLWLYEEWSQGRWGLYDTIDAPGGLRRGQLRRDLASILARPYPAAIAGRLRAFSYERASRRLTVQLEPAGDRQQISVPGLVYPNGVRVWCGDRSVPAVTAGGRVQIRCADPVITVEPAGGGGGGPARRVVAHGGRQAP
ncbi:MAG: cellulase family glycosylhydrolase, partial [Candidatus Binatia bacterium]